MPSRSKELIASAAIVVVSFLAVFFLSGFVEGRRPKLPAGFEDSDLAVEGKRLKGYALGAEGLIADWYWIMSLQYIGGKIVERENEDLNLNDLTSLNPRLLYPYLDNATDLDPKFFAAYSYGAIVLPAIDPSKAIALTEKGIANNPDKWRFYQYLGYIHWHEKNYAKAAEVYEAGSKIEGAPAFMRQMAAAMISKGGSRETARAMYTQMLAESEDEQSKRNAQMNLLELDALDELDAINTVLEEIRSSSGRCPTRLNEIFQKLRNVQLPNNRDFRIDAGNSLVDPTGIPYQLNAAACKAELNKDSKIPKPIE